MPLKINTAHFSRILSEDLNEKIQTIVGRNCIVSGFSASKSAEKLLSISAGKLIISGAIISDEDITILTVPSSYTANTELKVVMTYHHLQKTAMLSIVMKSQQVQDNQVELCTFRVIEQGSSIEIQESSIVNSSPLPLIGEIADMIGSLSELSTTNKSDVVSAINEVLHQLNTFSSPILIPKDVELPADQRVKNKLYFKVTSRVAGFDQNLKVSPNMAIRVDEYGDEG